MVISFDTPTKSSSGILNNTGTSAAYINYLAKEQRQGIEEHWFSYDNSKLLDNEVRYEIDRDHQGIGKQEGKFSTGSINLTEEEWKALGEDDSKRLENFKNWVSKEFTSVMADNFKKKDREGNEIKITPESMKIYYKIEHNRYYKGFDEEVKQGLKEQGEAKEGFNLHCHFIIARKTADGKNRISPTTKNRKEFDRTNLINSTERSFDKYTGYDRTLEQKFDYFRTMKNGSIEEKLKLIEEKQQQQERQQQNDRLITGQNKADEILKEHKEQEQKQQREQNHNRSRDFDLSL